MQWIILPSYVLFFSLIEVWPSPRCIMTVSRWDTKNWNGRIACKSQKEMCCLEEKPQRAKPPTKKGNNTTRRFAIWKKKKETPYESKKNHPPGAGEIETQQHWIPPFFAKIRWSLQSNLFQLYWRVQEAMTREPLLFWTVQEAMTSEPLLLCMTQRPPLPLWPTDPLVHW